MDQIFSTSHIDAVMHFAAVAYVGESMEEPLRYASRGHMWSLIVSLINFVLREVVYPLFI